MECAFQKNIRRDQIEETTWEAITGCLARDDGGMDCVMTVKLKRDRWQTQEMELRWENNTLDLKLGNAELCSSKI